MIAYQIHEYSRTAVPAVRGAALADDALKPLAARTLSNRNKHDSLFVKLFHQRSGDFRAAGRDNDTVVRRGLGHTEGAVPEVHPYRSGMQEVQDAGRALIEPGQTLHRIH